MLLVKLDKHVILDMSTGLKFAAIRMEETEQVVGVILARDSEPFPKNYDNGEDAVAFWNFLESNTVPLR